MRNKFGRILSLTLLVVLLTTLLPSGGLAATKCYRELTVTTKTYMYKSASTAATKVAGVPAGATVVCGAYTSDWCYVKYSGKTGYILKKYVKTLTVTATPTATAAPTATSTAKATDDPGVDSSIKAGDTVTCTRSVTVYTMPSVSENYASGIIVKNTVFTVLKTAGGVWAYIKLNGKTGYCLMADLVKYSSATSAPATAAPTAAPTASPTVSPTAECAIQAGMSVTCKTSIPLYVSPNTSGSKYGIISKGKVFSCLKTAGGVWAYVKVSNQTGYVLIKDIVEYTGSSSGSSSTSAVTVSMICYVKDACTLTSSMTSGYVASLAKGDKVLVTKIKGSYCFLTTTSGKQGYLTLSNLSKTAIDPDYTIVLSDWFKGDIQNVFPVGSKVKVIDVATRTTFAVYRRGGIYHADCEPLTASDTAKILDIYGGSVSWNRRAIWVVINNKLYAASMNFMNHGEQTILNNNFEGHFCIHFLNSLTHGTQKVDADHMAAIRTAYTTKY